MIKNWFSTPSYGLFMHYLAENATTREEWNRRTDAFDVERVADQAAEAGAKWLYLTVGQNSGFYCSPNQAYDAVLAEHGIKSKCSERDLVSDLADALLKRNVYLMVYSTSMAAFFDDEAIVALKGVPPWNCNKHVGNYEHVKQYAVLDPRLRQFQVYWEAIHREWSRRWGTRINGWWIDGTYYSDQMYRHPDAPNFGSFVAALRAGNPEAMVAFNPGIVTPPYTLCELEDYTAGETEDPWLVLDSEFKVQNGVVKHILTYTGVTWRDAEDRFSQEELSALLQTAEQRNIAVTLDVGFSLENGYIDPRVLNAFRELSRVKKNHPLPLLQIQVVPPAWSNTDGGRAGRLELSVENTSSSAVEISSLENIEPFVRILRSGEKTIMEASIRAPMTLRDVRNRTTILCNGLPRRITFAPQVCYHSTPDCLLAMTNDRQELGRVAIQRTSSHLLLDAEITDPEPEVDRVSPWHKSCFEVFMAPIENEPDDRAHLLVLPSPGSAHPEILKMVESGGLVDGSGLVERSKIQRSLSGYNLHLAIPWSGSKICRMDLVVSVKRGNEFPKATLFLEDIANAAHLPEIAMSHSESR